MKELITKFAALSGDGLGDSKVNTVGDGTDTLSSDIQIVLNGIIAALGVVCVIVIIIGGINYMTSGGDTTKVKKGKDTILYGVIGLVICVLAAAIVNFVIMSILNQR